MTTLNVYENLYISMRNKFTVTNDNRECTLGEYMSEKANIKHTSNLPVKAAKSAETTTISAIFSYVNNKLTVKKEPVKDKTMRAFPFRTSLAACFSAVVACLFIFSFGIFSMRGANVMPTTVDASETEITEVEAAYDTEANK